MAYSEPKVAWLKWLLGSRGVEEPRLRQILIANMFTRTSSMVTAAVSELIVAATAMLMQPNAKFAAWIFASTTLLLMRLGLLGYSKHAVGRGRATPTAWLIVTSLTWAAMIGVGALLCDLSGDAALQVLSNVCVTAILGGLIARNASTPRLALAQMLLALSFVCLGATLAPQHWLRVLLIQAPLFSLGLAGVCLRINRELVAMLKAQDENAALARNDSLTSLPNRIAVTEALEALVAEQRPFGVITADLDGFKAVNDTLGHAAGDFVLVETGRRIQSACGENVHLISRLGGDEFLIVVMEPSLVETLAAAVNAAIALPYVLPEAPSVRIAASMGAAVYPKDGPNADAVLSAADKALYAGKRSGKGGYAIYDTERHGGEDDLILFRSDLETALRDGADQLILHYQPVMRLSDGRVGGREALVRWRHPTRGLVSPADFVPIAEASGLIIQLGSWVVHQACADAARWTNPVKVAVNVSPVQLRNDHFATTVAEALFQTGLPSERLEIEVTETVLLSDDAVTQRNISRIRDLGVEIVLDDFGTGFSSLANLCRFTFDRIKIDGSFVREALHRRECAAVIRATVQLARELGVPTTAECIETPEQLEFVRGSGCSDVQGYLLGKPEPPEHILSDPLVVSRLREPAAA